MKIIHDAKLDMYNAVISYCLQNAAIMDSLPASQIALTALRDTVEMIFDTAQLKELPISGITADKNTMQRTLTRSAIDFSNKLFAYATFIGSSELKKQVSISEFALVKLKDEELFITCKNIVALANANLAALASYSITADTISQFEDLIAAYQREVPRSRNAVSNRAGHVKSLVELFKTGDGILKYRLDKMMATFKVSNTPFYNRYMNNRIIIDPRSRATQMKGIITNDINGEPISDAKIEIIEIETAVNTRTDGKFLIKPVAAATYTIKISKEGFQPQTLTEVQVKTGQIKAIDVSLLPDK